MTFLEQILSFLAGALPELNNSSSTSIVRRMVNAMVVVLNIFKLELDRSTESIEMIVRNGKVIAKLYYEDQARLFQEGYALTIIDPLTFRYGYSIIDESAQIIKIVTVETPETGRIIMRVNNIVDQQLLPLTISQLQDFTNYESFFIPAGILMQIVSPAPAIFTATSLTIRYQENYSLDSLKPTITQFLLDYQEGQTGGNPIYINDIEGGLRGVDGVADAYFDNVQVVDGSQTLMPVAGQVVLVSGAGFNFDPVITDLSIVNFVKAIQ